MKNNQIFGAQLRELRKKAGLTLRELAEKVNVNFTYLSKIENGALPPPSEKVIRNLAEILEYDKDELLALAGIVPADIAEILKDRRARERLRAEQARREKSTGFKFPDLPKVSLPLKGLYRLALPVFLVIAVALSIWYASPTQALQVEYPNQPASGTLGSTYTFSVKVSIEDSELLPLQQVTVVIYNETYPTTYKATLANLPLGDSATSSHTITESNAGSATAAADADAAWGYFTTGTGNVAWESIGYTFAPVVGGYGYQGGTGTTSITYTIVWTSPSNWPTGSYKIDTTLTTSAQTPGGGTTFVKSSGTFTLSAPSAAVSYAPTGGAALEPTGKTYVYDKVTSTGRFTQEVTASSADGLVELNIARDVIGKTATGHALSRIDVLPMDSPPEPPSQASIIGLTYDFGPAGATFEPAITVTLTYDPVDLPAGVDDTSLKIGYYDSSISDWVILENIQVDTVNHTVSAQISHFTPFSVIVFTKPAAFTPSNLTINPTVVNVGEVSSVTVTIANSGDHSGAYDVVLKINNTVAETKTVTIAGHSSQEVSFSVSQDAGGTYNININGLLGELTVKAPPAPEPEPEPTPAPEPEPKPTPAPEPEPEPTPTAPEPEPTPTAPEPVPEEVTNWWLIGGIIAVVIIVAVITWLLVFRRRHA